MTTIGALDEEWNDCHVDPKWLIVKTMARKGCCDGHDAVNGWIGHVSHHLGSVSGAIALIVLRAFVCGVGCFDAQIGETLLYK